ncbi:MAG TPA: sigma-54 dependent transcriptional regulator, partial [Longimicrobiales bacterium]|nr:sigma-54 dependent transcriptional regulator [Longimicrobiales bacterium]
GKSFVPVNCAAIPEELIESELFGHERGAFTGAVGKRRGRFELASEGTIFLDEVGDMSPRTQAKILRVLEEKAFERIGGGERVRSDARVIAATNRSLPDEVAEGRFREDLFFRLNVFPIFVPPLRDRKEDIPVLADHFAGLACRELGKEERDFSREATERLLRHSWPGNVRELRNVLERCVLLSTSSVLPDRWLGLPPAGETPRMDEPGVLAVPVDGRLTLDEIEARVIREALGRSDGNVSAAARLLGVTRQTLRYRIEKHEMAPGSGGRQEDEGAPASP